MAGGIWSEHYTREAWVLCRVVSGSLVTKDNTDKLSKLQLLTNGILPTGTPVENLNNYGKLRIKYDDMLIKYPLTY